MAERRVRDGGENCRLGGFFWTSLVFRAEVSESGRCTAQDKDGALTSFGAHRLQQTTQDGGVACNK